MAKDARERFDRGGSMVEKAKSFGQWVAATYANLSGVVKVAVTTMAADFGISRNAARKYLELCVETGFLVKLREWRPRRGTDPGEPAWYQLNSEQIEQAEVAARRSVEEASSPTLPHAHET